MYKHLLKISCLLQIVLLELSLAKTTSTSLNSATDSITKLRLEQCREGCLKKFSRDDRDCTQEADCFSCLDECNSYSKLPTKEIRETWGVSVTSLVRENSLVSATISWEPSTIPSDCLVTWEVSGGGLIGNLLTQSSTVELSLWPDTKYRVQVTCKNRIIETVSRSIPITLDTSEAVLKGQQNIDTSSSSVSDSNTDELFSSIFPNASTFDFASLYNNNKELILGTGAAIVVFFAVLVAFIVTKRKSRASDKVPLVDNEVAVNLDVERLTIHV